MYGKVFDTIYNGTLYGHWEALVTMQQMIVLADADGVVDMTPMAISARTSIPREIIDKGLEVLEAPDKFTRTPGSDGRRIELIDEHRPWGCILVNYEKYKGMRDAETVRAQTKARVRKHRKKKVGLPDAPLTCAYCGEEAHGPDHIIPTSKGGSNDAENIVACCIRCNRHKGVQTLTAFFANSFYDWLDFELIHENQNLTAQLSRERGSQVDVVTTRNAPKRYIDIDIDIDIPKTLGHSVTSRFEDFWKVYPRKVKKADALKKWKLKKLDSKADMLIADVENRVVNDSQWRKSEFIPHPTTYLNGERWNDELTTVEVELTYAQQMAEDLKNG